MLMGI
ncbi:hypothetical protein VC87395_001860A, partial [Vibrio paracholerae 87395]